MRRAWPLLLASIALGSGCAGRPLPTVPPAPVLAPVVVCPAPVRPGLPALDGTFPFDSPANVAALLERDDVLRGYAKGLEATVDCYRAQTVSTLGKER